jgi:hypothetical protein
VIFNVYICNGDVIATTPRVDRKLSLRGRRHSNIPSGQVHVRRTYRSLWCPAHKPHIERRPATRGAADARKRVDVRGGVTACRSDLARAQPGTCSLRTLDTPNQGRAMRGQVIVAEYEVRCIGHGSLSVGDGAANAFQRKPVDLLVKWGFRVSAISPARRALQLQHVTPTTHSSLVPDAPWALQTVTAAPPCPVQVLQHSAYKRRLYLLLVAAKPCSRDDGAASAAASGGCAAAGQRWRGTCAGLVPAATAEGAAGGVSGGVAAAASAHTTARALAAVLDQTLRHALG